MIKRLMIGSVLCSLTAIGLTQTYSTKKQNRSSTTTQNARKIIPFFKKKRRPASFQRTFAQAVTRGSSKGSLPSENRSMHVQKTLSGLATRNPQIAALPGSKQLRGAQKNLPQVATTRTITPLPKKRQLLPFKKAFSQKKYENICSGHIPGDMEDRWFSYCKNNWVYFHRSWTGHCIFQVKLEKHKDHYSVKEAWVNRDERQYKNTDVASDCTLLNVLLSELEV